MRPPAYAALLTPEGRGAIAVVRVWGPGALEVADHAFRPLKGRRLAETKAGRTRLGRMGTGEGDEVVAFVVPEEPGRPPEVEVHGHGGVAAVAMVMEALRASGAEIRTSSDWLAWSSVSRLSFEARVDLPRAGTVRVAEMLMEQAAGALDEELRGVVEALAAGETGRAVEAIDGLIERSKVGLRLVGGWSVALAGRPNMGKSRLMNALAGYDRAIVSPTPGTTRDLVTARTAIDGWPVELIDTAGVRETEDPLESLGVERARRRHETADVVVLVLDRSEPLGWSDIDLMSTHQDAVVVANKSDLAAAWSPGEELRGREFVEVSAATGQGVESLVERLGARLVPEPPSAGLGVPFRPSQVARLRRVRSLAGAGRLESARRGLEGLLSKPRAVASRSPG